MAHGEQLFTDLEIQGHPVLFSEEILATLALDQTVELS